MSSIKKVLVTGGAGYVGAVAPRMDLQLRRKVLFEMLRIRLVEETIAARYAEQEMRCPVHLSVGQEAVAAGVCAALAPQDYVMSTHRAHAHYLAKGGSLKAMMAEIYGKATGCCGGRGGSMHLIDLGVNMLGSTPIVGSSLPVAVGTALGSQMNGEDRVTAVFFGDGTTEEGVFSESLNFAVLKKLPVVFICENNYFSVYSPLSVRQPPERSRVEIARAHGMRGALGDGNDVEEVYRMTSEAAERARRGEGPTYLEFDTYRWREHCGPNYDNDLGYRTETEYLEWRERCPIESYKSLLMQEGELTEAGADDLEASIHKEIDEAFNYAKASPFPDDDQLFVGLYAGGVSQ
jgi:TPP-dependent pyruvate/acetoin dehydrogenase alpha subunit